MNEETSIIEMPVYYQNRIDIMGYIKFIIDKAYEEEFYKRNYEICYSCGAWRLQCSIGRKRRGHRAAIHQEVFEFFNGPVEPGMVIDHINTDSTDNRIVNLRMVTRKQNCSNSKPSKSSTSKYKGVSKLGNGKWRANIGSSPNQRHLGIFDKEEDAALAYDKAAIELYGEYAYLNFKENKSEPSCS